MSGSVADALLASGSGSKKLPLLPAPPKRKKEPKTFCFDLELTESTDEAYPEFSWTELIRKAKEKDLTQKAAKGNAVLDPFASDDEEDLKAMAAKFEAKYNTPVPPKKKKRRLEDYIDKGAGYDESDPFIDNSDVYDEVVPADLQTVHGGFYINSGSLDFKEVELSEDEEDSRSQPSKSQHPPKKAKVKITPTLQERGQLQHASKNPVGRPPGSGVRKSLSIDNKSKLIKKKRIIITPVGPAGKLSKLNKNKLIKNNLSGKLVPKAQNINTGKQEVSKVSNNNNAVGENSSSSDSGSSSSDDSGSGSSSSDSESSSSEGTEEKEKQKAPKKHSVTTNVTTAAIPVTGKSSSLEAATTTSTTPIPPITKPKLLNVVRQQPDSNMPIFTKNILSQPKRVKTKNVPLNPKLHPNLPSALSSSTPLLPTNNPPPPPLMQQPQQKALSKDLIKSNGTSSLLVNLNARSQSQAGSTTSVSNNSSAVRVPTPKPINASSSMSSSSLSISAVTTSPSSNPKPTLNNVPTKVKTKPKQSSSPNTIIPAASMPTISPMEIFSSIATYTSALERPASLSSFPGLNFVPQMTGNSSLIKTGMNILNSQKSMPNLKKIPQQSPSEKLVQKPKAPKAIMKEKPKVSSQMNNSSPRLPSTSFSGGSATPTGSYLSGAGAFKTPPPLAGPGVEISKVRSNSSINSTLNSTPKASPNSSLLSSSPLSIGNSSIVYTGGGALTSNSIVNTGITSILNSSSSSPNSLANSVPSSLTVQRLPQSITITPSGHYSGGSAIPSKSMTPSLLDHPVKTTKQYTSFDVSALLQSNSNCTNSIMSMNNSAAGGSKSGAGKAVNSIVNSRDLSRK